MPVLKQRFNAEQKQWCFGFLIYITLPYASKNEVTMVKLRFSFSFLFYFQQDLCKFHSNLQMTVTKTRELALTRY